MKEKVLKSERKQRCTICLIYLKNKKILKKHIKTVHLKIKP